MNKFGFNTEQFSKVIKVADKEATNVYHYGHSPAKPEQHEGHTADGKCSSTCNLVYWAKQAKKHIEDLTLFITIIEKIMDENEGYEVVATLKECINQLNISMVTIPGSFELIHNYDGKCSCNECLSGITLKKFGVPGFTPGSPVLSVSSLKSAMPNSSIKLFDSLIYTKDSNDIWSYKESSPVGVNYVKSEQFIGLIQSKFLTWVEHLVPESTDLEGLSEIDTEIINSPWFNAGTTALQKDFALAPIGAQIEVDSWIKSIYEKINANMWKNKNGDLIDLAAFTAYKNYKWIWIEPKPGTPCDKAKKDWKEAGNVFEPVKFSSIKIKEAIDSMNNAFSKITPKI